MILGTVPYLNALPLTSALPDDILVMSLSPTELSNALFSGKITAGLIPAYSIIEHDLNAYPEAGLIGCDGEIKSVGFFTRDHITDLAQIDTIYFDQESQSSVRLAQILLAKMFNRNLKSIKTVPLTESHQADALMLIGDKALFFKEDGYCYWDLGHLWKELTGFGFVFAVWASLRPLPQKILDTLTTARRNGWEALPSWLAAPQTPRDKIANRYVQNHVVYEYTDSLKNGFDQYARWLGDLGLCQSGLRRRVA